MYCVNKEENARSNKENERDRFNTLNIKEKGELELLEIMSKKREENNKIQYNNI